MLDCRCWHLRQGGSTHSEPTFHIRRLRSGEVASETPIEFTCALLITKASNSVPTTEDVVGSEETAVAWGR